MGRELATILTKNENPIWPTGRNACTPKHIYIRTRRSKTLQRSRNTKLLYKAYMACDLSIIVKVTGSPVHFKSGSIQKLVLDRNRVTTGH